jgi:hypothetical protein
MADNMQNSIPAPPEGFTEAVSNSPAPAAPPAPPAGFQEVQAPGILSKVGQFVTDTMSNAGGAALSTAEGGVDMAHNALHKVLPEHLAEILSPNVGMNAEEQGMKPLTAPVGSTASKVVGYGGENLMEFLLGDEALKALPLAEQLTKAGGIAKVLQSSPRLMEALQKGAALTKLAEKYPRVAELLKSSVRAGITQGVQTTVKTGGDVGEGVKQGAEVAGGSIALGAPFSAAGALLSKGVDAGQSLTRLSEAGAKAPEKSEGVKAVRGWINDAEQKMHGDFESGITNMKDDLAGETVKPEESALAEKAQELLQTTPGEGPKLARELATELKGIVPGTERTEGLLNSLANPVREAETTMTPKEYLKAVGADKKSILKTDQDKATVDSLVEAYKNGEEVPMSSISKDAEGNVLEADGRHRALAAMLADKATIPVKATTRMSDFDIDGLVDLRQKLGAKARELPFGDPNARRLRQLQHAVDDDIQTMASNSSKPEVADNYQQLRETYRTRLADIESTPIEKLRADQPGKELNDVGQYVLSGGNSKAKLDALRRVIGPQRMDMVADSIATNWLHDATNEAGKFDPEKFLNQYNKVKPDVRDKLFASRPAVKLNDFVTDAKSGQLVQRAIKAGLLTTVGGTLLGPTGVLLGLVMGTGDSAAAHIAGRGLLDYVVNHPKMWVSLGVAEKVATSKTVQQLPKFAAKGVVSGYTPNLRTVYAGASPALGGTQ